MKYCTKCGNEVMDEAVVCPNCGCELNPARAVMAQGTGSAKESGLAVAAKIFMLLACISVAWAVIPLAWCIPMTVSYWKRCSQPATISTGFKVCTLLFVNMIAGILMLADSNN